MGKFEIRKNEFYLEGKPFRILSGAMHYFRVHPAYWEDRLKKMLLMGLNTVETYVAWNMHEPKPGTFVFDGWMDIVKYIETAAELGLNVIVRPGPYICSEWDFGGLPAWLLRDPGMQVRCCYRPYLDAVERYFSELLPRLAPLQITRDGPIIAMQIENEYGSYGNDTHYLEYLEKKMRAEGIDVLLFTSDGATDWMLETGTLPHVLKTVNFASGAREHFSILRSHQPEGPLMCTEFWNGWFDHWGEEHHIKKAEDTAAALDEILSTGASVNFYMFHGGTNFGFMNGANFFKTYQATVTSYDYDAPLNEQGDITPKFEAFRDVIAKYHTLPDTPLPKPALTMKIAPFELTEAVDLFSSLDLLSTPIERSMPEPMENLDQNYGFILYKTHVSGAREEAPLIIREVHDRAHVFVNWKLLGIIEREFPEKELKPVIPREGIELTIIVENMGRINFGRRLIDRKGITECVLLGDQILHNWTIYPLPLDDVSQLKFEPEEPAHYPAFFRSAFQVTTPQDSFLSLEGWTKGVCWINGFNVGRYWNRGPQQTLFIPKSLFKKGRNEIVLLELDSAAPHRTVEFRTEPT